MSDSPGGKPDGRVSDAPADDITNVAIACQGGGSHTAFSAGVLQELLENWPADHELVGISGTSGGAFNALAAWFGLVTGDEYSAVETLAGLWDDLAADGWADGAFNAWAKTYARLEASGVPLPRVSPYQLPGSWGQRHLARVLERHVDFDAIPDLCGTDAPELVVGTVDVNGGEFETFTNEAVTTDAVLASAAVPYLFEAVEIDGHLHWDGLFSQNPPIHDLLSVPVERKPQELWVIQINPQESEGEPRSLEAIADRRNELSGNISLNQELGFLERVNDWIAEGYLPTDQFTHTEVRRIQLLESFQSASKVDRSPEFIAELQSRGRERAAEFLAAR
ncbi:MAG: patatin-like phospholipase family protein [Halorientalis sp.]